MLKVGDRLGYIKRYRTSEDEQYHFEYIESKVKSIYVGKKATTVRAKGFYTLYLDDIEFSTECMRENNGLVLVNEVFLTNDELAKKCKLNCDYWNEHGAKSVFDNLKETNNERQ